MFAESLDRLVMDYSFTITTRAVSIRLVTNRPASGLLVDVGALTSITISSPRSALLASPLGKET